MKTIALLSMLHESATAHSAIRPFRAEPVLAWTVRRLKRAKRLDSITIAAWEDQAETLAGFDVNVRIVGERRTAAALEAITAAQKWSNGWRGGLLATCAYDRGYLAGTVLEVTADADAVVLVDPASALVDAGIIDRLIDAAERGARDYYFTQSPPGLAGVLLKRSMVQRLADGNTHPGKVVHYLPEAPVLDPVTSDACVDLPLAISRSTERFLFDSSQHINRLSMAAEPLNGTLISTSAEGIVGRLAGIDRAGAFPREITLELTTRRSSKPIFAPGSHLPLSRSDLPLELSYQLVDELIHYDGVRLCLAGAGDPLLHPSFVDILTRCADLPAVSIETDLIDVNDAQLNAIVRANVDVVSIHLPAMTPGTYAQVMGVDALSKAVDNVKRLLAIRQAGGRGTPILAPTFMKLASNLDEMEQWYDTWLRAVGSAVILGPSDFAGQIPDCSAANMTPPLRRACARIESRLTILSDGSIVMCEQDAAARFPLGKVGVDSIADVWQKAMGEVRDLHRSRTSLPVLCGECREWHRA